MKAHRSFRHEALLYRDMTEFLDSVVPFITDGLALDQSVMVAVTGSRLAAIRDALGSASDRVTYVDLSGEGRNPARVLAIGRQFIDSNGTDGQPMRGVGESIWAGRRPPEIAECQFNEGLLNVAISPDTPFWLLCPYEVTALGTEVAAEAHRSHPVVIQDGVYRGSTAYSGAYHVQTLFNQGLPQPVGAVEERAFGSSDLGSIANRVRAAAFRAGLSEQQAGQLAVAVREIAQDATAPGLRTAILRLWVETGALACEVSDATILADPFIGRAEATTSVGRKGLWRANQVCDLIQVRSNDAGTTVRVYTWI